MATYFIAPYEQRTEYVGLGFSNPKTKVLSYGVKDSQGNWIATGLDYHTAASIAQQLRAKNSAKASTSSTSATSTTSKPKLMTSSSSKQDYATQIMDTAVRAGLEHQKWIEKQQEGLLNTYKQKLEETEQDTSSQKVSDLMEAGTAEIQRAQQQALHTVSSSLAAKGLLGSSAAESAYAKIAGETASQLGVLAAETQKQLLETQTAREASYMTAINQLLSIPTLQGYQQLGTAGANASLFAIPSEV